MLHIQYSKYMRTSQLQRGVINILYGVVHITEILTSCLCFMLIECAIESTIFFIIVFLWAESVDDTQNIYVCFSDYNDF